MSANDDSPSGNLVDPVSGRAFAGGNAPISSIYRGRAYYFESRENRSAFESNPEKYAGEFPAAGQKIGSSAAYSEPRRRPRRRGC